MKKTKQKTKKQKEAKQKQKQKKSTENRKHKSQVLKFRVLKIKNGNTMMISKCEIRGSKKSRFIKKQEASEILSN